jgi:hypothetical protein
LIIYDFFAGTGSATRAFEDAGHTVIKVELDGQFTAHEQDILDLTADYLITKYGQPDFIWASPPCTSFSVASIGRYWNRDLTPKRDAAELGLRLVDHTKALVDALQPKHGWIIENPRGMLRKLRLLDVPRRTVTYCQYGDTRMKPTDLWGYVPGWISRPPCKNGDGCHEAAPRGSTTGTQGIKGAKSRSMIPYDLGKEICEAITNVDNTRL